SKSASVVRLQLASTFEPPLPALPPAPPPPLPPVEVLPPPPLLPPVEAPPSRPEKSGATMPRFAQPAPARAPAPAVTRASRAKAKRTARRGRIEIILKS